MFSLASSCSFGHTYCSKVTSCEARAANFAFEAHNPGYLLCCRQRWVVESDNRSLQAVIRLCIIFVQRILGVRLGLFYLLRQLHLKRLRVVHAAQVPIRGCKARHAPEGVGMPVS